MRRSTCLNIHTTHHSVLYATGVALGAGLVGLLGLPRLFGALPDKPQATLWLALSVGVCVVLIVPTRALANALWDTFLRCWFRPVRANRQPCAAPPSIVRVW